MDLGMHVSLGPGQEGMFFLPKRGLECARVQRGSKLRHSTGREMNQAPALLSRVCPDLNPVDLLSTYSVPGTGLSFVGALWQAQSLHSYCGVQAKCTYVLW